jgi:DNA-binding protein HU-beta/integration host factor subunit beta
VTKRELVIQVSEKLGFTQNEVSSVVQATLDGIVDCLVQGQRLEIRNFGVFEVKKRDARMGRNPRTGAEVPIAEKRVPAFKPGKALKEWVQDGKAPVPDAVNIVPMDAAPPEPAVDANLPPAAGGEPDSGASL